jgi:hypothetical protein
MFLILSLILIPSTSSFDKNRLGPETLGFTTVDTAPALPALPKREQFFDFSLFIHQLLMSITQGEHELQRYFGSFTNNIPIGFIQQVYAAAKTVTANGNAKVDTSQSKFGGASGSFDGTNSYLSTADSSDWNFGTGDFTIDFWVYPNTLTTTGLVSATVLIPSPAGAWKLGMSSSGAVSWSRQNVAADINSLSNLSTGAWTHVAIVRNGNAVTMYFGGSFVGSFNAAGISYNSSGNGLVLGRNAIDTNSLYFNGWLDEVRVTKGLARWTSSFTPPTTEYPSDSNTALLLHMNGANGSTIFTDDSAVTALVSFGFNVKGSATQIVTTLTYSWTGSGAPPQGSITIAGPGGTPSYSESGAVVYDRTSIAVSGITSTYNLIHRVTFTITAPGSAQVWTAYVSLSGVSSYTLTIEVS